MKRLNNLSIKPLSTFLQLLFFCSIGCAQTVSPAAPNKIKTGNNISLPEVVVKAKRAKLPNKQQISMRAPAKVRIDGKANEWNNQFQAYNHATEIFYTLCNDDDNLYLVIKAIEPSAINRILGGGVTFTIQKSLKKTDKNAASITYPAYTILTGESGMHFNLRDPKAYLDTLSEDAKIMLFNHNQLINQMCKLIRVTGVTGLDTLISAFNDEGVLATGMFDLKEAYTFELRVALKHLSLSANDETKFAYHIQLNGTNPYGPETPPPYPGKPPLGIDRSMFIGVKNHSAASPDVVSISAAPTDFWAEYILAKK